MSKIHRLPDDQVLALYAWKKHHGRYWRANLRTAWMTGKYGRIETDTAAALQRLRNTAPSAINDFTEGEVNTRVHHIRVIQAAQSLLDKIAPSGNMHPTYHAVDQVVALQGLLQEAPAHYDRDL